MSLVFHPPPSHTRGAAHGTMKLLTHNLLQSPGTRHGYPLAIEAEKVETVEIGRCRERVLASLQGLRSSEASRETKVPITHVRRPRAGRRANLCFWGAHPLTTLTIHLTLYRPCSAIIPERVGPGIFVYSK